VPEVRRGTASLHDDLRPQDRPAPSRTKKHPFASHTRNRNHTAAAGSGYHPSPITFGRDGIPYYVNGPYEDPERVLVTLERAVGRGGFHHMVSLDELGGLDGGYRYTVSVTDMDELGDAA
jgi:hypothetical protein